MKLPPLARKLATVLVVGAGVAFLWLTIQRNWTEIGAYDWQARWGQLSLSVVLLIGSFAFSVHIWRRVLDRFASGTPSYPVLLRIWFTSKIARYIPGKIWQFVAVGQLSVGAGSSARVMVSSMLVQTGFLLLSGIITAGAILAGRIPALPARAGLPIAGAMLLALLASHPRIIDLCLRLLSKITGRTTLTWTGGWRDSAELMLLSLVNWGVQGLAFFLFAGSLVHLDASAAVPLIGMNAFAFVAGYLAFVAPAGAGVREATMASLLRVVLPSGAAAVVAIVSRLWLIAAELIGVVLVLALIKPPRADGAAAAPAATDGEPDPPEDVPPS